MNPNSPCPPCLGDELNPPRATDDWLLATGYWRLLLVTSASSPAHPIFSRPSSTLHVRKQVVLRCGFGQLPVKTRIISKLAELQPSPRRIVMKCELCGLVHQTPER